MMQRKIIRQKEQIKCRHCCDLFTPEPRSAGRQEYCSKNDECKKASKAASQTRWRAKNPDHFKGSVNVKRVQLWRKENPGYSQRQKKRDTLQDSLKTQPAKNTDNFDSRFLLNAVCVEEQTPLVSGAAIRMECQVIVFANQGEGPCYRCLYKDDADDSATTCSENGVLAPVVGIIGSIQAVEAMKVIMSLGKPLTSRLLLLDAYTMDWRSLKLPPDPDCPVCSKSL